jgi:hypothetical protein
VAIEPQLTAQAPEIDTASAIENEIPTYRAISTAAVISLVCGVLAIFSFAHWMFLTCAVAAIVLGVIADRNIRRMPDVLTGRGLAQAGMGLGLVFGLAAVTTAAVQDGILSMEARKFARVYETVLQKGSLEEALWFEQHPEVRSGKTPEQIASEIRQSSRSRLPLEMEKAALVNLRSKIHDQSATVHFDKLERHGKDGLNVYAAALYELDPAAAKPLPPEERYAMVFMKGTVRNRRYEWWVEQVNYPYQPSTFQPPVAKPDDGHGHAH